ncbi:hypothetical protein DYI37_11165 [Fulvimarina endophytica]|uniref:SH3b domain-containing protein n=1 Tax=Fulvimarina endophytica TaxID=2293836 RepID=A0A371X2W2_9HYPH|nr:SH3 domain-containing protein [Fulvimarina endophytica]RFC63568.1 hypothetical protein DYI37_11165 [Fulvimarina endophytica]
MNKPGLTASARPSEEAIRDRLKNRRSLYELDRASDSMFRRVRRGLFEAREDVSMAAPIWQRYPVQAFTSVSVLTIGIFAAGAFLANAYFLDDDAASAPRQTAALAQTLPEVTPGTATSQADDADVTPEPASARPSVPSHERRQAPTIAETEDRQQASSMAEPAREPLNAVTEVERLAPRIEAPRIEAMAAPEPEKQAGRVEATSVEEQPAPVDRSLQTGSTQPATRQTEIASMLDEARRVESMQSAVWPDMIGAAHSASETAQPAARTAAEPIAIEEPAKDPAATLVPVPDRKPETLTASLAGEEPSMTTGEGPAATGSAPAAGRTGFARTFVNMRRDANMDAEVMTVIAEGAPLTVFDCGDWCHVRYQNTEGYVFNTFVTSDRSASREAGGEG